MRNLVAGLITSALALRLHLRAVPLRHPDLCIHTQPESLQVLKNALRDEIVPSVSQPAYMTDRRVMEVRTQSLPTLLPTIPNAPSPLLAPAVLARGSCADLDMRQKQAIPNPDAKKFCLEEWSEEVPPRLGKQPRMLTGARLSRTLAPDLLLSRRLLPKRRHRSLTEVPTEKFLPLE